LEMHAVRLSLLLGQSCTESGPRRCWRSAGESFSTDSAASPKELRPITITFGKSWSSQAVSETPPMQSPLITSMKQFRLTSS
jgi:hypothetical protein